MTARGTGGYMFEVGIYVADDVNLTMSILVMLVGHTHDRVDMVLMYDKAVIICADGVNCYA